MARAGGTVRACNGPHRLRARVSRSAAPPCSAPSSQASGDRRRPGHQPRALGCRAERPGGFADALLPGLGGGWRIYSVQYPLPRSTRRRSSSASRAGREAGRLRWSEVAALPGEHQTSDFHCVTGWRSTTSTGRASGRRPSSTSCARRPAARYVTLQSLEGPYVDQISLHQFREPDVMLARHMDGKPLTRSHGAPLRLVLPSMYGYKGVKWVREIRFDARRRPATGSSAATTSTPGSASPTAMARPARGHALHAHRARGALAAGRHVLRDALQRPLPERLGLRGHPRPPDGEGLAHRSASRSRPGWCCSPCGQPARAGRAAHARSTASTATTALAARRAGRLWRRPGPASGPLQRRPEAQRRPDGRAHARRFHHRLPALVRRAGHPFRFAGTVMVHDWVMWS